MPESGSSSSDPFVEKLDGLQARMARLDERMAGSSIRERRPEASSGQDAFELRIKTISNAKR